VGLDIQIADAKLCLDTTPIIYFIERNETYINLIRPIFARIDAGKNEAITSTITLLEVLVHPYRTRSKT
jgi:predicted nucleic acid-binding protein